MVKQLQTKLILLLCMLVAGVSSVWGDSTEDITQLGYKTWNNGSYTGDVVTITAAKGSSSNPPATNGTQYRVYNGNTVSISVSSGYIKSIKFVATSSSYGVEHFTYNNTPISNTAVQSTTWNAPSNITTATFGVNGTIRWTEVHVTYTTGPSLSASDVNIASDATSGEISYSIENPDGSTLSANESCDWISNVSVDSDNNKVSFSTETNSGEERSGVITLSYGSITKDVTVTQAAYVAQYEITIMEPTNGTLTIQKDGVYLTTGSLVPVGTKLLVTATPNTGYKFKNWQYNAGASWNTRYTTPQEYEMPSNNVSFRANFEAIPQYTYTWYVDEKVVKTETLYEGADVEFPTVTIPSYTDKEFYGWVTTESVDSEEAPTSVNTTDVRAGANTNYYAVFATKTAGSLTEHVDVITRETTGVANQTGSTIAYTEWEEKQAAGGSDAVYAGQSAGDNNSIQLRSKNSNSGIVSTTSGGTLKKIVIEWNSNTSNGKVLDIYGKTTAYTAASDLYASASQGTKLGSVTYGTSTELIVTGNYSFVGLRSNDGAIYLDKVSVTWGTGTPDSYSDFTTTFPKASISINAACNDGNGAYYGTFYTDQAYVMHDELAGEVVSVDESGKMTIDEVYSGGDVVPAYTGLLIMALEPGEYKVNITNETGYDWSAYNMLKGTLTADETTVGNDCLFYRLTMHNGTKIGFWWGAEDGGAFMPGANKAYLAVPNAHAARISGFSFDSDNTTTAIENVKRESQTNDRCYNLNGQRVNANMKGIVIVNGKKMINK